jgi:uncharacterized protein YodC (DUF2158 family)
MHVEQGHHMANGFWAEDLVGSEMIITHDRMEGEYRCRVFRSVHLLAQGFELYIPELDPGVCMFATMF